MRFLRPNIKKATEELLSKAKSAGAREVTWLIKKGADVNAVEEDGKTPLILASESNNNPGVLSALLEKGADINAVDDYYERTPLMYAAFKNSNTEVLTILIDNGADVAMRDYKGKMALNYAYENEKLKGTKAYYLLREKTLAELALQELAAEVALEEKVME